MNDLNTPKIMKWLHQKGIPLHRAYDIVGWLGFGYFFLAVGLCIVIGELPTLNPVIATLAIVLLLGLLSFSGYCVYMGNTMWLMLLLFGPIDILMAFVIDMGTGWRVFMGIIGGVMTLSGIWLAPRQLKNAKGLKPQLEALSYAHKHRNDPDPVAEEIPGVEAAAPPKPALLEAEALWVLVLDVQGQAPAYMGTDGRMELFTMEELAVNGQEQVQARLDVKTRVRKLQGPEEIRRFFADCAYNGYEYFRLNNGTPLLKELRVGDYGEYICADPVTYNGRVTRNLLSRAKQYGWQLGAQTTQQSHYAMHLLETMLTMRVNGYRELANSPIYVLGPACGDGPFATAKALERMPKGEDMPKLYEGSLSLAYVNRPGQQGNAALGSVCAFTDLALAEDARQSFRRAGMEQSVLLVAWEELAGQAMQCSGIVLDMQRLGYEIEKREYPNVTQMLGMKAGLLVHMNRELPKEAADQPTEQPLEGYI